MGNYKGDVGEYIVESILQLCPSNIKYIHNMVLPSNSGTVTQIDFVILTPARFIALEVKNWDCLVNIKSGFWELLYDSGKRLYVDPVKQNQAHVKYLERYSSYEYENKLFFTDKAKFIGSNDSILNSVQLITLLNDTTRRYTNTEIKREYDKLVQLKYENFDAWLTRLENYEYPSNKTSEFADLI